MSDDWESNLWRMLDDDPRYTPETKAQMRETVTRLKAEVATNVESDPAVWEQAREFMRAMDDVQARLFAGEIDGNTYHREQMALLDTAPMNVMKAANSIQQAIIKSFRDPGAPVH